ncbi:MAG: DEAD/DEAH box helicase [Gammaproteobacteria bacterium]|nr:DEAD/DEAH box helicase [Gammaproteobacteria bacterium]
MSQNPPVSAAVAAAPLSPEFAALGLSEPLLKAIADSGYTAPTPIQAKAIPLVLEGRDLLAGAQTGTGKTAGFTLPILERLSSHGWDKLAHGHPPVRCLILTPTRELAAQVEESVRVYGKYLKINSTVVFGGVGINPQIERLRRRVDIVVATPGRLLELAGMKAIDLSKLEILVLDEADRMLDMGFIHDIKKILRLLPKQRQNLLFSATYSDEIRELATGLLHNPAEVEVARRNTAAESVAQTVHLVDRDKKKDLLSHLIQKNDWRQVLVFTRMKHGANRLAEKLEEDGISTAAIHGNKSQNARVKALADFKSGAVRVLVATDIAARGIDIDQLPHVVNYELPNIAEDYVHRIGRTGRAGAEGEAVSLVCVDELEFLVKIERLIKRKLDVIDIPGFEADLNVTPEPIQLSGNRSHGRGQGRGRPGGQGAGRPGGQGGGRAGQGSGQGQRSQGSRSGERGSAGSTRGNASDNRGQASGNRAAQGPRSSGAAQGERAGEGRAQQQRRRPSAPREPNGNR